MLQDVKTQSNRLLKQENAKWPVVPVEVPPPWPGELGQQANRFRVLRSRFFLIQLFREIVGIVRISVNRTLRDANNQWKDGITWDELQQIKQQCGYGDREAVEIFPPDRDVVNVANLRHLWVLPPELRLPFAWRKVEGA